MISIETIRTKIQGLPYASQREVLDRIDELLEKAANADNTHKVKAWEDWAKSLSPGGVIKDDSREILYEDE